VGSNPTGPARFLIRVASYGWDRTQNRDVDAFSAWPTTAVIMSIQRFGAAAENHYSIVVATLVP